MKFQDIKDFINKCGFSDKINVIFQENKVSINFSYPNIVTQPIVISYQGDNEINIHELVIFLNRLWEANQGNFYELVKKEVGRTIRSVDANHLLNDLSIKARLSLNLLSSDTNNGFKEYERYQKIESDFSFLYNKAVTESYREALGINTSEAINIIDYILSNNKISRKTIDLMVKVENSLAGKLMSDYNKELLFSIKLSEVLREHKNKKGGLSFAYGEVVVNHPVLSGLEMEGLKYAPEKHKKILANIYINMLFYIINNKLININNDIETVDEVIVSHIKNSTISYKITQEKNSTERIVSFNGHVKGAREIDYDKVNLLFNSDTFVKLEDHNDVANFDVDKKVITIMFSSIKYTNANSLSLHNYLKLLNKQDIFSIESYDYVGNKIINNKECLVDKVVIKYKGEITNRLVEDKVVKMLTDVHRHLSLVLFDNTNHNRYMGDFKIKRELELLEMLPNTSQEVRSKKKL